MARNDMARNGRQIEFPGREGHSKGFEAAMVGLAILCVIIVLFILLATNLGTEFRPTV
jgi:hypothetical protein